MFLLVMSDVLSSGLWKHFRFQHAEALRFFFYNMRRLLDQTSSIPDALGYMRCVHWVNDYGLNTLHCIWELRQNKEATPHNAKGRDLGSWSVQSIAAKHMWGLCWHSWGIIISVSQSGEATWSMHRCYSVLFWHARGGTAGTGLVS